MDLKEIKLLIEMMRKNDLSVFKMEKEGFKITLKRGNDFQPLIASAHPFAMNPYAPSAPALPVSSQARDNAGAAPSTVAVAPVESLREINSPMVGTFYGSPSPDAKPFVQPGTEVTEDTVVCIIEAMKVMNEIKAGCRGIIAEAVAENGKAVQYGQTLFRLR